MKTDIINKTEIKIIPQEHSKLNKSYVGSWGNGYLQIPKGHLSYDWLVSSIKKYPHGFPSNICGESITYSNVHDEYVTIGFDTLHSFNNETHDKEYVLKKCNDIKDYFNSRLFKLELIRDIKEDVLWHQEKLNKLKEKIKTIRKTF